MLRHFAIVHLPRGLAATDVIHLLRFQRTSRVLLQRWLTLRERRVLRWRWCATYQRPAILRRPASVATVIVVDRRPARWIVSAREVPVVSTSRRISAGLRRTFNLTWFSGILRTSRTDVRRSTPVTARR